MRATNLTRVRGFLEARFDSSSSSDLRLVGVKPLVSGVIAGKFLGMVGAGELALGRRRVKRRRGGEEGITEGGGKGEGGGAPRESDWTCWSPRSAHVMRPP